MNFNSFSKPELTEPGVKYFLSETLKQCHIAKDKFNNLLFNFGLFLFFIIIFLIILFLKYKGKLTPVEKEKKNKEKKQYILSKIQKLQESKKKAHQELITGLPNWENDYNSIKY